MCIAAAMQQWNLHRRIALAIMRAIGTDPRRLLFGILVATAFISLWISNTATATMMLPIGLSVIVQLETHAGGQRLEHYGASLMLAVAYAANVGGIGTKIGTAPNAQFASFMAQRGVEISFLEYMAIGLPFVLLFLPVVWLALWRIGRRDAPDAAAGRNRAAARRSRRSGARNARSGWCWRSSCAPQPSGSPAARSRAWLTPRVSWRRAQQRARRGGHRDDGGHRADAAAGPRPAGARAALAPAASLRDAAAAGREPRDGGGDRGERALGLAGGPARRRCARPPPGRSCCSRASPPWRSRRWPRTSRRSP